MTYLEFIPNKTYSGKLTIIKTKKIHWLYQYECSYEYGYNTIVNYSCNLF